MNVFSAKGTCCFNKRIKTIDYLSNMGNKMNPYPKSMGKKLQNSAIYHEFKNNSIREGSLLKTPGEFFDSYDYHKSNCGNSSLPKTEIETIHS